MHAPIHHHVLELGIPQLADKQVRVKPTDNWEKLKLLCGWLEQKRYEEIRPLDLFGSAVVQYAMEGGTSSVSVFGELHDPLSPIKLHQGIILHPTRVWIGAFVMSINYGHRFRIRL